MEHVAVLDIGKTNVKLSAATAEGAIVETVTTTNNSLPGPPYLHPDSEGLEHWFLDHLRSLARRHPIGAVVVTTHGSLGALVGCDRLLMPMVDYEHVPTAEFDRRYRDLAGPLQKRGSTVMPGLAHLARQLLFLETGWPEAVARANHFLGGPQYWAWRLTGVGASEVTYLGAQSHLWDVRKRRFLAIVEDRGWRRLLPPPTPAWHTLGTIRPELVRRHGLPEGIAVLCGIHDSTANFYRFQQAGLTDFALISTGTWIVGLGHVGRPGAFTVSETRQCNADVEGRPLSGALTMGGREFAALAGDSSQQGAELGEVGDLVAAGTMALPSFAEHDALFPERAGKGRIIGPKPQSASRQRALALLYVALTTDACLDALGDNNLAILDGSFVSDPLYPALVAALRPGRRTVYTTQRYGTAAGAALLAGHGARTKRVEVDLRPPERIDLPPLAGYAARWRRAARASEKD